MPGRRCRCAWCVLSGLHGRYLWSMLCSCYRQQRPVLQPSTGCGRLWSVRWERSGGGCDRDVLQQSTASIGTVLQAPRRGGLLWRVRWHEQVCGTGVHPGAAGGISQLDSIGSDKFGGCGHGCLGRRSPQQWAGGCDTDDADQRHGEWHGIVVSDISIACGQE
jgi:hypothetical protein